jgi:ribosomal protein S19
MFLINSNSVYNTLVKRVYNGSSIMAHMFVGYEVFVYSGMKILSRLVTKWSVGLQFGSLS